MLSLDTKVDFPAPAIPIVIIVMGILFEIRDEEASEAMMAVVKVMSRHADKNYHLPHVLVHH